MKQSDIRERSDSALSRVFVRSSEHLHMPDGHMEDLYQSRNPLVRWVHLQRLRNTASLVPLEAKKVLDVGCGEGHLLEYLARVPRRKLYGIDLLQHVVEQARQRVPHATITEANATRMPFSSGMFDAVTCIDVLEHLPNWRAAVREIVRVTKTGGRIVLGWPNDDNWNLGRMILGKGPVPDHINILTPRIIRQAVQRQPLKTKRIPPVLPWKLCLTAQELFIK
jgi:2-polyprenyl-3-methyl-5-hydroxy-6-metoxy-1,4-benzoquinol methylase